MKTLFLWSKAMPLFALEVMEQDAVNTECWDGMAGMC